MSGKGGSRKSLDAIRNDVIDLDDTLNEKEIIQEFGRKMLVRIKDTGPNFLINLVYKLTKNIKLELLIEGKDYYEEVDLNLKEFYEFYNLIVLYSMTTSNYRSTIGKSLHSKKPQDNINKEGSNEIESYNINQRPSIKEDKICVICFSKTIQNILPCLHGFCEDCCTGWYEGKGKNDCLLCRTPIGEGSWNHQAFQIMNTDTVNDVSKGLNERKNIVEFVNKRSRTIKLL